MRAAPSCVAACVCVCVCVCVTPNESNQSSNCEVQHSYFLPIISETMSSVFEGLAGRPATSPASQLWVRVRPQGHKHDPRRAHPRPAANGCMCVCVPRYPFQSCSNCEVQHSYILPLLQTISSVFGPAGGQPIQALDLHMYRVLPTHHSSWPCKPQRETTRHTLHARVPYRSPQTIPMRPCERRWGGGGHPSTEKNLYSCVCVCVCVCCGGRC